MSEWISSRDGEPISTAAKISSISCTMMLLISRKWFSSGRAEFFRARHVEKMVELLPAFDVGFDLGDELVEFFGGHRRFRLAVAKVRIAAAGK